MENKEQTRESKWEDLCDGSTGKENDEEEEE